MSVLGPKLFNVAKFSECANSSGLNLKYMMLENLILIDQLHLNPLFIILISNSPAYSREKMYSIAICL
jgi:hypothetical protein